MIHQTIVLTHNTPFTSLDQAIAEYSSIRHDDLDAFFVKLAGATILRSWDWDENQKIAITTVWVNDAEYEQYLSYETQRNDVMARLAANGWTFVSTEAVTV